MELDLPLDNPLTWVLVTEQVWFILIYWRVRQVHRTFSTDEGVQGFSDRIVRASLRSILGVPAALGAMFRERAENPPTDKDK